MKKQAYFLLVLMTICSAPFAASAGTGNDTPVVARAKNLTMQIAAKAHLNEGQYLKVKQLNLRMLTAVEDLKKQYANDQTALDEHLAQVQFNYEWDLASILGPRQMVAYDQSKSSMTALNAR